MRSPRPARRAAAHRFSHAAIFPFVALTLAAAPSAAGDIRGLVVDQAGQALPRVYVRVVDSVGAVRDGAFTDESGRFRLAGPEDCRVEAGLTGFQPATVPCAAGTLQRITLRVAPVEETVVVTATRTELPSAFAGAGVTTFTAEDLERRRVPLVSDLLRSTPGAVVVTSGGLGGVSSLFMRGGESSYNKVLLDGVPINEPGGTFNFSNVATDGLERVEIVRGAQSALFGSDAMAGVVQLFTKRAKPGDRATQGSAALESGTFGTLRANASASGMRGRLDYALSAARLRTDNNTPNDTFENTTVSGNGGLRVASSGLVRFVVRAEMGRTGVPGQTAFGRPDLDAFFDREDTVAGVTFDQQLSERLRQRASVSSARSTQQSTNLLLDPPYTPRYGSLVAPYEFFDFAYDSRTRLNRLHASYQADWRFSADRMRGSHLLTALVDWDGEHADLDDRLEGTSSHASRNNFGWSIQDQGAWRRLFVTAGARLEHNASFGTALAPRASVVVVAHQAARWFGETTVHASEGGGVKEPTILQSFSLSPFFLGNPNLKPERSRTFEAGAAQRLALDRARLEFTWFDGRFRDLISTKTLSFSPFRSQYFNVGLTRARGTEATADLAPISSLRVRGGYTFLASEVLESTSAFDDPVFRKGQWLLRRPRHSGYAGVGWAWRRATANVDGVFVGRSVDSDFSSLEPALTESEGHRWWTARATCAITRQLTVLAAVDNVLDSHHMEPLGYPVLGRAIRLGARVTF